jgi:large subunit ribosomal protein L13
MAEKKASPKGAAHSKSEEKAPAKAAKPAAKSAKAHAPVAQKTQNPFTKAKPRSTWVPDDTEVVRRWYVVDATGLVLGRAASRIAYVLRGKHKPTYTPHADQGDYVVVVNAEKIKLTGSKEEQKPYYHHTMHPGGLKTIIARDVRVRDPERLMQDAVRRMIPRNPLGRDVMSKLHVYKGPAHPHQAQKPEPLTLP